MIDTLWMFTAGVDVAKVEAERYPSLADVQRESFAHRDHQAMLAVHALEQAKFVRHQLKESTNGTV